MKVEFTGIPSRIPIELNGINMGDFNWRGLLGNSLFIKNLKSSLIETNLVTTPGYGIKKMKWVEYGDKVIF